MKKNDNTVMMLMITLGIIIAGIILTTIIRATKETTDSSTRAATDSTLALTGVIESQGVEDYSVNVNNVQFENNPQENMGLWKVVPPTSYEASKFPIGTNIRIDADPKSFSITGKTLRAVKISKR